MAIENATSLKKIIEQYDAKKWISDTKLKAKTNLDAEGLGVGGLEALGKSKTFGEFLSDSVSKVNNLQNKANVAIQKLAAGETKNIHETMLLVEQADIAFRTMNQVRQKVLDAYKEVMRMQV